MPALDGSRSRARLALLCSVGAVAVLALAVYGGLHVDLAAVGWFKWIVLAAAVATAMLLRGHAWGLWIYFLGFSRWVEPPGPPARQFGDGSLHVNVNLRCPRCRVRADTDAVTPAGYCRCAECGAAFVAVRRR